MLKCKIYCEYINICTFLLTNMLAERISVTAHSKIKNRLIKYNGNLIEHKRY